MYYIGAILIPLISWYLVKFIKKRYFTDISEKMKDTITLQNTSKQRIITSLFFILCFLCMELFWRVIFEFFIAYFDMHDALLRLNTK
jgi:hypothetical protein